MDGKRFDELAKTLARVRSRRELLKVAGAGLLGVFAGVSAPKPAGAQILPCPAGQYDNNGTCTACAAGSYSAGGTDRCTPCPAGTSASSGAGVCASCAAGSYAQGKGNTTCTTCPADTYADQTGSDRCTKCPKGTTSAPGSTTCS